jgi:dipeptidyl aminopeptidase/acylaminoacyl peptidase
MSERRVGPLSAQDVRGLRFVREAGFASAGRHVFHTMTEIDATLRERESLWLLDLDDPDFASRRIAPDLEDVSLPAVSPDGSILAVVAMAKGTRQIYLVPVDGGQARPLTALPQGVVGRPVWSPDGRSIAFAAGPAEIRDPSKPYRIDRVTYRFDGIGNLDDAVTDLFVVAVETGALIQLTDDRCMNADPRWSPDGSRLSYLVSFPPERAWTFLPELHVLDLQSGEPHVVVDDWGGAFAADWCPDGERVAFIGARAGPGVFTAGKVDLWTVQAQGGAPECRTTGVLAGVGFSLADSDLPIAGELGAARLVVSDGEAFAHGRVGSDLVAYRIALDGPERVEAVTDPGRCAYLADVDPRRGVLHLATTFVEPPELALGAQRLTDLNGDLLGEITPPATRRLEVMAPDGVSTEAWALTPSGDGPWPTVLSIHSGPYQAYTNTFSIDFHRLVGAGFAVVFDNYRGSGGYGAAFARRIVGDWGHQGSLDHHATVDEAIRAGIADPERVGVFGNSAGAFGACWLVGTSNRFRAAVAQSPITDFSSFYGGADAASWLAEEMGGPPDEVPERYRERSALTYAPHCRTPLLFIVGESDLRAQPLESEQYYRVLKRNGVPSEMLRLPNSSHIGSACGPVAGRVARGEALVDWFVRHLR